MDILIQNIKNAFLQHERNTRPKSSEKMFKPLLSVIERAKSLEELPNQLVEIANKLIIEHSVIVTDDIKSKIRELSKETIRIRILN